MSIIDKYNATLDAKRNELATFASNHVAKISLPNQTPTIKNNTTSGINKAATALLVGGAVVLIGGIAMDKPLIGVFGGIVCIGGIAIKVANRKTATPTSTPSETKYYQITDKVYAQLSDIQKHLFDEWKQTVEDNKDKLKSEIQSFEIDDEKKDTFIQAILSTSVLDISMMTVSSELSAVEKQKNIDAYRIYLQTFQSRCLAAIDKAAAEQKAIYAKIAGSL